MPRRGPEHEEEGSTLTPAKTMTITVRFFGGLREASGTSMLSVSVGEGGRFSDLTTILADLLPHARERIRAGLAQGYVHVLVDGHDVDLLAGEDPILSDGATVVFIPPLGGG